MRHCRGIRTCLAPPLSHLGEGAWLAPNEHIYNRVPFMKSLIFDRWECQLFLMMRWDEMTWWDEMMRRCVEMISWDEKRWDEKVSWWDDMMRWHDEMRQRDDMTKWDVDSMMRWDDEMRWWDEMLSWDDEMTRWDEIMRWHAERRW